MPFKSKNQMKACFATDGFGGKIDCHEWAKETGDTKSLPKKVKKSMGGASKYRGKSCMECGGQMPDGGLYSKSEIPVETRDFAGELGQQALQPVSSSIEVNPYDGPKPHTANLFDIGIGLQRATLAASWLSGIVDRGRQNQYMYKQLSTLGQRNSMPADDYQPNPYSLYAKYGGSLLQYKKGGIKINPEHKGWCTPITKSTCTGKRRAFALMMKKHHGFPKK